jgi:hypothetical protein
MKGDPKNLIGEWRHSHEEDSKGLMVFRPASHKFPPSRGRLAFKLLADGTANYAGIGANDAPDEINAKWSRTVGDELTIKSGGDSLLKGKVVAAEPEKLVLKSE